MCFSIVSSKIKELVEVNEYFISMNLQTYFNLINAKRPRWKRGWLLVEIKGWMQVRCTGRHLHWWVHYSYPVMREATHWWLWRPLFSMNSTTVHRAFLNEPGWIRVSYVFTATAVKQLSLFLYPKAALRQKVELRSSLGNFNPTSCWNIWTAHKRMLFTPCEY